MFFRYVTVFLTVFLSACSTLTTGTEQTLLVYTPKVVGAKCTLTDSTAKSWALSHSPGSVMVAKGDGPMTVVCSKAGYKTATLTVDETFAGATLGNIILGGGIGILIDAASGAAQQYPDDITVWMQPEKWSTPAEEKAWNEAKQAFDDEVERKKKEAEAEAES